jgi:hypothetical protein
MQTIDPQKVLLITNSNVAQSSIDADDYVIKRGLNSAHRLSFNFSTSNDLTLTQLKTGPSPTCTTNGYTGQYFIDSVVSYVTNNGIEAVILSTYTPCRVDSGYYTLSTVAGWAVGFNADLQLSYFDPTVSWGDANVIELTSRNTIEKTIDYVTHDWKPVRETYSFTRTFTSGAGNYMYIDSVTNILIGDRVTGNGITGDVYVRQTPSISNPIIILTASFTSTPSGTYTFHKGNTRNPLFRLPHGRLGCPDWSNTVVAELPLINPPAEGTTVYTNAVTNALVAETQNHNTKVHALSQTNSYSWITQLGNKMAHDWAKRMGMPNVAYLKPGATASISRGDVGTNYGISSSTTVIPVTDVTNFPSSGIVRLDGPAVTTLATTVNVGDNTCKITDKNGFINLNSTTTNQTFRIGNTDNITYNKITGTSSPYIVSLVSPATFAYSSGTIVYSRSLTGYEAVSYTSISTATSPPTLVGCVRADNDANLRDASKFLMNGAVNPPYSHSFVSGSLVTPIFPPATSTGSYYLQWGGLPSIDPTLPQFFALCVASPFNFAPTIYDDINGKVLPGAWGMVWTSSMGIFGTSILRNGGSAAVFTYGEPYANGIPPPHQMFIYTSYYKMPLMLANMMCSGYNQGSTVCGDPLYTPYLSTPTAPPVVSMSPYGV